MLVFRLFIAISLVIGSGRWLAAAELTARDLASADMAVLVEFDRPAQLIDNPLVGDVWGLLKQTAAIQKSLASPEFEKFRHVARFVGKSLDVDWKTGISKLTAGGIVVVIHTPKPQSEPDVTVVVTAADESTMKQFMGAVQSEIRRAAGKGIGPDAESASYRSFTMHRVGNGLYSLVGRQLVVSNTRPGLEAALDRLAGAGSEKLFALPPPLKLVDSRGNVPAIRATVNLNLFRQDAKFQDLLKLPANDPAPQFLLGGYLDLLRRADFAAVGLSVDGPAHELKLRIPAGFDGARSWLPGFFACSSADSAAPLLKPTGALFSASWFRDYRKLWDARHELLNAELAGQLDRADEHARSHPTAFGISDVLQWLGPQIRVVAAKQREQIYLRKIEERLPAVGLAISVRDEAAVRDRFLAPVDGLLLVALNKNIEDFRKIDHSEARITTFRFSEQAAGSDPKGALLFHLNPAYALSRGHLILGSTAEIVRDLIDELDRQQRSPADANAGTEHVTDRQQLDLGDVSEFLRDFQERFVRDLVREHALTPDVATKELDVLHNVLKRIRNVSTSHVMAADHFDITLSVGPGE